MRLPIALTVAILLSSAALAQQETQTPPASSDSTTQTPPASTSTQPQHSVNVEAIFDKLDVNHDGKISPDEAQAHPTVASHFESADANHDGVITKEEFMTAFRPQE